MGNKNACWVLSSRLIYFWRNVKISSIFYFSKSTSINTQYSSLWHTLEMILFTKYLIKWKRIGGISWKPITFHQCQKKKNDLAISRFTWEETSESNCIRPVNIKLDSELTASTKVNKENKSRKDISLCIFSSKHHFRFCGQKSLSLKDTVGCGNLQETYFVNTSNIKVLYYFKRIWSDRGPKWFYYFNNTLDI